MKIALLNDTHFGIRNSGDIFLDNAAKFYDEVFFPYMREHNIKQIVHLGDYYDNRKAINIKADLPSELVFILDEKENYDIIDNNLNKIKQHIKERI